MSPILACSALPHSAHGYVGPAEVLLVEKSEIRNLKSEILYLAHWPTIISAYKYTYNVNGPWAGRLPKDCNISRYHGSHPTERK